MSQRITSHDVARAAQVSQATVSRALRGDPKISESTVRRVREAADRLGYVPSNLGRSLSRKATGNIAVVAELGNLTYPDTLPAMHDELDRHGYRLLLVSETPDKELDHSLLFDGSVDGVILTTSRLDSPLPARLQERRVPFVFLNRVTRGVEADTVVADNAGGGRLAARLLLGDGHTRVAMLAGPSDMSSASARERAFTAELREAGIDAKDRPVIRSGLTHDAGHRGWGQLMGLRQRPTAVFCTTDAVAVGLLNAWHEQGDGPRPAVVGFDNSPVASWPTFDLTTIDTHLSQMARTASSVLVERLTALHAGQDPAARRVVVPTELVVRRSHVVA
ncbi:LacI family DNA-binding transcriptional regulator [Promicromonospora sp. NPDC050880]|uniref:LacI family DNA-binding transcriptional regulator n=1 Tax=Promicromonospora sp. NPDC050880 TaxID=3364406 RepID=UPI0037B264E5